MKAREAKMKALEKIMDAEAAELQNLVDEMNASTGDKKLDAMAAVLNKMVQSHKQMKEKMAAMHSKPKAAAVPRKKAAVKEEAAPAEDTGKDEDPHGAHKH